MLFFLTGDIQIGKTRWLQSLVTELERNGVTCYGVMAPGIWRQDGHEFEKLGIENELLPQHERVAFALRSDMAQTAQCSQSAAAGLRWQIDDVAIEKVNAHFQSIGRDADAGSLLVVDELGQLELLRDGGLTAAVELLDQGPSETIPHAIVIVRERLVAVAEERFAACWPQQMRISPDDASRTAVLEALGL